MEKFKTDIPPQLNCDTDLNREFVARILMICPEEIAKLYFFEQQVRSSATEQFYCLGHAHLRDGRPVCFIAHYNTDPHDDDPERDGLHSVAIGYGEACPIP
jgi:hypothetical protein